MSPIGVLAREVVRDAIRRRIQLVVPLLFVGFAVVTPIVRGLALGGGDKAATDVALSLVWLVSTVLAVVLGATAVRPDAEAVWLLVRPVSRGAFTVGRFAGVLATLGLVVAALTLAWVAIASLYGIGTGTGVLWWAGLLWCEVGLVAAWAALLAHLFPPIPAGLLAAALWASGHQADALLRLAAEDGVPGWLPAVVFTVVPDLDLFDVQREVVHGLAVDPVHATASATYALAWMVVLVGVAVLTTARRDLP